VRDVPWSPVVALLTILVAACSVGASASPAVSSDTLAPGSPANAEPVELTILAAASLSGILEEATIAYEAGHPGTSLTVSTDSSSALETQIEQGAPADVFLSADTTNPEKLVEGGFAAGTPVPFAGNELTIIVPADNPGGVTTPADLARPGLKVVAAAEEVPITKYATQLLANLAGQPGYPAGFEAAYAANVVSREDNVRAVVAKIELGEGDAGIVYVTDAATSDTVTTVDVPEGANVPASYAGVVVGTSRHLDIARAFLTWFAGPDGREILAGFGFLPPGP
jgi:molybdate transport system substrate-binding protein